MRRTMALGLRELVGRAMVDQEFLTDLQRSPETVLADYELNPEERATVLSALGRLAATPAKQRAPALRSALLRRVST